MIKEHIVIGFFRSFFVQAFNHFYIISTVVCGLPGLFSEQVIEERNDGKGQYKHNQNDLSKAVFGPFGLLGFFAVPESPPAAMDAAIGTDVDRFEKPFPHGNDESTDNGWQECPDETKKALSIARGRRYLT